MPQTRAAPIKRMMYPDGHYAVPIRDEAGNAIGAVAAEQGVTAARQAELALGGSDARLQDSAQERLANPNRDNASRILLVDDDEMVREVLVEQLADYSYDVLQAEEPAAALAVLDASEAIDLLISDLMMPGMDGIALIREAHRRRPKLPAILLTGYIEDAAALAIGKEGENPFRLLRKPISGSQLANEVSTLLEGAAKA